MEEAMAA
jgi:hypothetical protein